jgi:hypothetical protein
MSLSLKTINVSFTDNLENQFAVELFKYLKKKCKVSVAKDYYSTIDITITDRKDTSNRVFLELKSRKDTYKNFPTFLIGYKKMLNIRDKKLNPSILIWKFSNCLYFCDYKEHFCHFKTKVIQNSSVVEINKCICSEGIEPLVKHILLLLNLNDE